MAQLTAIAARIIGYRTRGDWNVEDLTTLLQANSRIYNVLSALRNFRSPEENTLETQRKFIDRNESTLSETEEGKQYIKLYKSWLALMEKSMSETKNHVHPSLDLLHIPIFALSITYSNYPLSPGQLYSYEQLVSSMRIYRIHMSSPGGISLTGIADIMKEIREFIKDIWFRNSQEKASGQLAIIEKYVDILLKVDTLSEKQKSYLTDVPQLCRILDESVSNLRRLEENKLLDDIPSNLDYITER
jgi:hypothetical protein